MTGQPKPCPFCGSDNVHPETPDRGTTHLVRCRTCGARSSSKFELEDALRAWNRREMPWVAVAERLPDYAHRCLWCDVTWKALWVGSIADGNEYQKFTHWIPISDDFFPAVGKLAQGGAGSRQSLSTG